ncbi:MAG: hypothetical protein ACLSFW_06930 [Bacteroides cellulosilyticus]
MANYQQIEINQAPSGCGSFIWPYLARITGLLSGGLRHKRPVFLQKAPVQMRGTWHRFHEFQSETSAP